MYDRKKGFLVCVKSNVCHSSLDPQSQSNYVTCCRRRSSSGKDSSGKRRSTPTVMFDESDEPREIDALMVNPQIVVDPPSIGAQPKSDVKVIGQSKKSI